MPQLSTFNLPLSTPPGARLYHSTVSVWLSVDPLSDKYPSASPYVYCANNPVRVFDPNGKELVDNLDKWRFNTTTGRLSWLSDEGGTENQTVEFVHNGKDGKLYYNSTKSVNYNGYIGDMFDFSVVAKKIDGAISGSLDIFNGVETFMAGAGAAVATEGALAPLASTLCFVGGAQLADGVKTIATALSGENGLYNQQNLVKDFCKTGINFGSAFVDGFKWKNIFRSIGSATVSTAWSYLLYTHANHPQLKKIPKGSKITYSN